VSTEPPADVNASQVPIVRYEPSSLRGEPLAPRGSVLWVLN
jgi:hypothetical protein